MDLALLSADKLEDELEAGNIKGQPLAVTTGINMDKVLKLYEIEKRGGTSGNTINILALIQEKADSLEAEEAIDGEAKPLPDEGVVEDGEDDTPQSPAPSS